MLGHCTVINTCVFILAICKSTIYTYTHFVYDVESTSRRDQASALRLTRATPTICIHTDLYYRAIFKVFGSDYCQPAPGLHYSLLTKQIKNQRL